MNKLKLTINKYPTEGPLQYTYSSLKNLISKDKKEIKGFHTSEIIYDWTSSLDIEFQRSYDDSTNLILNNGLQSPRLVNSRFAKLGNNRYKFIKRNQGIATNMYEEDKINSQTDLFLRSFTWPIFDLKSVQDGGQLAGGNYVFYIKYSDEDDNLSDIVGESSVISIFNGTFPSTVHGTIMHEKTSKLIELKIKNLDTNYSKFYLYFTRETCDDNGINVTHCYKITTSYNLKKEVVIVINGLEIIEEVSMDDLNIKYNYYNSAKTQAVVQNMLFLGNVTTTSSDSGKLQQLSYYINTSMHKKSKSIGYINEYYAIDSFSPNTEYYDPKNIYYYLGYWPDEYYQIGVVYLLNDGSTTNAFMLRGGKFIENESCYKLEAGDLNVNNFEIFECNSIINNSTYENTAGIFKTPQCEIFDHAQGGVYPLYFKFEISEDLKTALAAEGVKGLFFVRSKRVPTSLFQGISCPIDKESGLLAPKIQINGEETSIVESFITQDNDLLIKDSPISQNIEIESLNYSALISLDPIVSLPLRNLLTWSQYSLHPEYECTITSVGGRSYNVMNYEKDIRSDDQISKLVYIDKDIPSFFIGENYFSTRAGNAETVKEFAFVGARNIEDDVSNLARGVYCPMIGCDKKITDSTIYTVKLKRDDQLWFNSLINQNNVFFSISNRYSLEDLPENIEIYRGDCFTNTVTIRLNRNFIDPTFPANDLIVDEKTWKKNWKGLVNMTDEDSKSDDQGNWTLINLGDVNNAPLGRWLTFKCLSNYNLGLRSFDMRDLTYIDKLGTKSSFYPITNKSVKSANKVPESELLNGGYSVTLGRKNYNKWIPSPYENYNFENRIAFSNISATKMFVNGFRIFQGLSYQDVDNQYGAITKLLPYGQNLLCIFEHGVAIIPINEKALLSTQEGLSIHLYGAGVLQEQVSVISPDYGSTWTDSIIKTPDAYYGVDTDARKIWKFNNAEGFQCISDFKIQSFLNDNINVTSEDMYFWGATNVKTHYNNFKGDVMFTFYHKDKIWNICYNERLKVWTSKYSWIPLLSTNIDNTYYSFNLKEINSLSKILEQTQKNWGIMCKVPIYNHGIDIDYKHEFFKEYTLKLLSLSDNYKNIQLEGTSMYDNSGNLKGVFFKDGISELNITNPCLLKLDANVIIINENNTWKFFDPDYYIDEDTGEKIYYQVDVEELEGLNEQWPNLWNICYSIDDEINIHGIGTIIGNKLYFSRSLLLNSNNILKNTTVTIGAYNNDLELEKYSFIIGDQDYTNFNIPLYVHSIDSKITTWYGNTEPFEYEFVVNQPAGFHKIFNNLIIISNNVEPDSLEVEIVGDVYDFKEEFISKNENIKYKFPIISLPDNKTYQTKLTLDKVTNENRLLMHQDCLNIKDFGRRLGNISYIEGKWYIVLQPIYYEDTTLKTTRLRDKWAKIRIKYSGEKLAIITAIQTLMNISYA